MGIVEMLKAQSEHSRAGGSSGGEWKYPDAGVLIERMYDRIPYSERKLFHSERKLFHSEQEIESAWAMLRIEMGEE